MSTSSAAQATQAGPSPRLVWEKARSTRLALARQPAGGSVFASLVGRDEQSSAPFRLAPSHVRFYRLAAAHRRLAFLAHLGWGKTSHAVLRCAHAIGINPATRLLYCCASHGEAQKRSRLLLSILKSEQYRQVFPHVQLKRESDSAFRVRRSTLAKDETCQSIGIGSEFLGSRVDGICLDDVATLEDAQSEATRSRKVEIVRSMLLPRLAPGGWVLSIATPWAVNDVSDVLAQTPGFHCERVPVVDAVGEPAFPEKFPLERIQALRAELGPFASSRALDLFLVDDSTSRIKRAWIDNALERGRETQPVDYIAATVPGWSVYCGVDLGISCASPKFVRARMIDVSAGGVDARAVMIHGFRLTGSAENPRAQ